MMRSLSLMSAAALLCAAGAVHAGSDSGIYVGGSIGNANVDYSDNILNLGKLKFDDDDVGYKAFVGYNLGIIPFLNLAIEGTYYDFGTQDGELGNTGIDGKAEVTAWSAAGLVGFNLGPFGIFGKVGAVNWDGDFDAGSISNSDDGTDPLYGLGAKFQIGSLAVRGEYELLDLSDGDIDYFSVGLSWTF